MQSPDNLDLDHDGVTDFTIRDNVGSCVFGAVVEQPAAGNGVIGGDYFAAASESNS
jgi:hypothetical protein